HAAAGPFPLGAACPQGRRMTATGHSSQQGIAPQGALLTLQDCTLQFGGLTAVGGLSFELPEGRLMGLIGPNGAGKTSVFNLVTGVYAPTAGSDRKSVV